MKKKLLSALTILSILVFFGCAAHTHVIGAGAKGGEVVTAKQWYIVFGLIPLNNADSKEMSGGATDYTIKTKQTFVDYIISAFTSAVTISCRSVIVEK